MPSISRYISCFLILLFLASLESSAVRAETTPQFQFAQTYPLTLDWKRLQTGIEIEIRNNSKDKPPTLIIQISIPELEDINGNQIDSTKLIGVDRDSVTLDKPADKEETKSTKVKLVVISTKEMKPGVYKGTLTATNKDAPTQAISRDIELVVAEKSSVDKLAFNAYRLAPLAASWAWSSKCLDWLSNLLSCNSCLPIDETSEPRNEAVDKNKSLGTLTGSQGGSAVVRAGPSRPLPGGAWGVELMVSGLTHTGKYEGPIYLTPSKEKADVTLTVYGKDIFVWPMIVIAFSIWLSLKTKQYFGVRRKIWGLREQEVELGAKFREQQKKFADAAQGQTYAGYTIANSLDEARRELREAIDKLGASSTTTLDETAPEDANQQLDPDNPTYALVVRRLRWIRAQLESWGSFGSDLDTLQQSLQKAEEDVSTSVAPIEPASGRALEEPQFLTQDRGLLIGRKVTLDGLAPLREKVNNATALGTQWDTVDQTLERYREWVARLEARQPAPEQQQELGDARSKVDDAWLDLWEIADADALREKAEPLNGLEDTLRKLDREIPIVVVSPPAVVSPVVASPPAAASATPARMAVGSLTLFEAYRLPSRASASVRDETHRAVDDVERTNKYRKALQRWDRRFAYLALVIALITGLNQFYLGQKPFGSLLDYVAVFLWGLTAKVAVDALNTILEKILNLQRPLDSR